MSRDIFTSFKLLKRTHAQHVDFLFGKEAPVATTEVLLGKSGKEHAVEFGNTIAKALEDAANDAVLAAVDLDAHL